MQTSNAYIAKLLREIAAAYSIKKKGPSVVFEIRAYENAADSIEHSTSEIKDLWQEGKMDLVPGLGKGIQGHLDELFRTGKAKQFQWAKKGIPKVLFELLDIPGIGPKTAQELVSLGIRSLGDLKKQIKSGNLAKKGFSEKIAEKLLVSLEQVSEKTNRMLLPYAAVQANKIIEYLKISPDVLEVDPLGSLRRQVVTIGDLDFSVSTKKPASVLEYFTKMPGVSQIVEKGTYGATVVLGSGLHVDLLVGPPESYGALLQHFTGGKNHNIKLRNYALSKGLSLSEQGVKNTKTGKIVPTKTEEEFYKLLKMDTPAPEIREDTGEIEAALAHKLPNLVELKDIKGDLHIHTNYPIPNPSHGPGVDSIEEMIKKAKQLGYEFIGISDHPPGHGIMGKEQMIKAIEMRTKVIQEVKKKTNSIRVLNGLEIDILGDGSLSVPDQALETLDYCIAGIHSGHHGGKDVITKRLLAALENPHVDIISHPTNRLLNERPSSEADWEAVFKLAAKNHKLMEINAHPDRLDLRDDLVKMALGYGVKFVINTDAHEVSQMENMPYGVSVARRGWAEKKDIVNTWNWTDFAKWFKL